MSIATAITNLQGRVESAYDKIEEKGGTLPQVLNTTNLPNAIDSIPQGEVDKRKFGATIDEVYNVYDTGPETNPRHIYFRPMYEVTEFNATDVTDLSAYGMRFMFAGKNNLKSVSFPALNTIGNNSFQSTFQESGISSVSFPALKSFANNYGNGKYAFQDAFKDCKSLLSVSFPALSSIPGNNAFDNAFYDCTSLSSVSFPEVKTVASYTFTNAFYGSGVKYVEFPKITNTSERAFNTAFQNCKSLSDISFPELAEVVGQYSFYRAFKDCSKLSSISFPELSSVSGVNAFQYAFQNCTSLTSVSFPNLLSVSGAEAFGDTFMACTKLTGLSFPKLESVSGGKVFAGTWNEMTLASTTVSFPELTAIRNTGTNSNYSTFYWNKNITRFDFPKLVIIAKGNTDTTDSMYLFNNCDALEELHFGAANQAIIEASAGYATKWGAPNANCQIYFDL